VERGDAAVVAQVLNVLLRAHAIEVQVRNDAEFTEELRALEEQIKQSVKPGA
jgi:hypothetical protein